MRGPGQQHRGRPEAALSAYQRTRCIQQPRKSHTRRYLRHTSLCHAAVVSEMSYAASSAEENRTSSRRRPCGQELAADGD